jgi:ribosomal protein S18 acetylase RimI-like enzyme
MRLEDWREWPADRLAPLFDRQRQRWRQDLGWDATAMFALLEDARAGGQLPGLVASDDHGAVVGWCCASAQDGTLFIGALHGDRADVVRALLDGVLATPEASCAKSYRCFLFPEGPAVSAALVRRRFDVQQYRYLSRLIAHAGPAMPPAGARPWRLDDVPATARLLAKAYVGTTGARCFAPGGRLDEWAAYLAQLSRTPACGVWAPDESFACPAAAADALDAVLIATRLAPDTSHVAQVVVDPRRQRGGLGSVLVEASARHAAAAGAVRQTLLVADANTAARTLYARLGFAEQASFLFAERPRISRVAAAAGPAQTAGSL